MEPNERTRDIYERTAYPEPPLIPIPAPGDLESLRSFGVRLTPAARRVYKVGLWASGFTGFQKRVPGIIDNLLRTTDMRGAILSAPELSATLAMADDPRQLNPYQRAATMLCAARSLYDDLMAGKLPPDMLKGQVLEMGQYHNLFSTCLIVENRSARIFKSSKTSQITVMVNQRPYLLEVGAPGVDTTPEQLVDALKATVEKAEMDPVRLGEPTPGLVTAAKHPTQLMIFTRIQRFPANVESLKAIRHSFLTICLDLDNYPNTLAEAAILAHIGNPANRWYHSSLQIVVFGNGMTCAVFNFSAYVDGNVMARAGVELQRRAAACPLSTEPELTRPALKPAIKLEWMMRPQAMALANRDIESVRDRQQETFVLEGLGQDFFKHIGLDPVSGFIIALQWATRRLTGKTLSIEQFLSMSKYRCMDLSTAIVTTEEMERLMVALEAGNLQPDQVRVLIHQAAEGQIRETRHARQSMPLHVLRTYYQKSLSGWRQTYVTVLRFFERRLLKMMKVLPNQKRDIVVSFPTYYPEVPVFGRPGVRLTYVNAFGLHYQIGPNSTVVTMMPGLNWPVPNTELIAELEERMRALEKAMCG